MRHENTTRPRSLHVHIRSRVYIDRKIALSLSTKHVRARSKSTGLSVCDIGTQYVFGTAAASEWRDSRGNSILPGHSRGLRLPSDLPVISIVITKIVHDRRHHSPFPPRTVNIASQVQHSKTSLLAKAMERIKKMSCRLYMGELFRQSKPAFLSQSANVKVLRF